MSRGEAIAVGAVTALAALLRFATLDLQSFWFDESVTVGLLDRGLLEMLRELPDSESTPPLYYVLAWLWARPFGTGEVGLRSLSALCGTLTVPVAYAAARELCTRRVALATAGLVAVSPFLVWYSQEARSYALLTLLGTLSLWLLARLIRRWSARGAALWALVCALALATHYFAVFLVAPQVLWLLRAAPRRRTAIPPLAALALAGAALLPLALEQRSAGFTAFIEEESLPRRVAKGVKQLVLGFDSPVEPLTAALAMAIAAAGILLALGRPDPAARRGIRVAASIGGAAFAVPYLLALAGLDYVLSRNLIVAFTPLTIVVAAGLTGATAGRLGIPVLLTAGALALASTVGVALEPAWQREDWRGAAEAIRGEGPRAILVSEPAHARPLALYLRRARRASPGAHRVAEVVVLARRGRDLADEAATPPDPLALRRLGLRKAGGRREPTYELARLVPLAGESVLTVEQLMTVRLARERGPAAVLLTP